jgi:hypothetical protein
MSFNVRLGCLRAIPACAYEPFFEVRSALDACQKATNRLAEFASTGIEPEDEDDQKP